MRLLLTMLLLPGVYAGCSAPQSVFAQSEEPADAEETRRRESAQRRERMQAFAASIQFFEGDKRGKEGARQSEQPILRFDDNARSNNDGTVWVWGRSGRPVAVSEIFSNTGYESLTHTGHSLSAMPLVGDLNGVSVVASRKTGVSWQTLGDGPLPATTEAGRLRQFKRLARRFTAHEFWRPGKTRYDLRLLTAPLYRYSDSTAGIVDGTLFAFCHGTNPEVIMLIESVQEPDAEACWQFAFARLAHAECHVELDGSDVWNCVRYEDAIPPGEAYWTFARSFAQVDNPTAAILENSGLRALIDSLFE